LSSNSGKNPKNVGKNIFYHLIMPLKASEFLKQKYKNMVLIEGDLTEKYETKYRYASE
jgi:hypothetical protein